MIARNSVGVAAVLCAFVVASEMSSGRAVAAETPVPVKRAILRSADSGAKGVQVEPVRHWTARFYGPGVYYAPGYYGPGWGYGYHRPAPYAGVYVGGPVGVYPPVYYPPYPGAYWAYGYPQYYWGSYYGW